MLNIKDCGFAYPKTFKNVLDYDKHSDKYKADDLVIKDDQKFNVCLVDNSEKFERNIKQYHKDLYFSNQQQRHKNRKKTNAQIEKDFYSTAIMRTFRIQVNSIELNKLNESVLDSEKIHENITAFYQKTLNQAIAILNHENNQKRQPLMIVKADVHFDQTNPHIHIHLSNFYEKKVKENYKDKEYKKQVFTNNIEQTDLINRLDSISKKYKKQKNIKISPNEIFTRLLSKNHNYKFNYLNKVDLKALYPKFFNLYENNTWKKLNLDFKNLSKEQAQREVAKIKGKWWKQDKQKYFQKIQTLLYALDFISDDQKNKIMKARKFNELVIYSYKLQMYLNLQKLNITDENKLKSLMNNEELFKLVALQKEQVIQPNQILFKLNNHELNLSRFDSKLKDIELHLKSLKAHDLVQFFQKEFNQILVEQEKTKQENLLLTLDLEKQRNYLKESISSLNVEQELAFDYGLNLIIQNHDLNYNLNKKQSTLNNFQNLETKISQLNKDVQKQIYQDLLENMEITKKIPSNEKSLEFAKLEKYYLMSKEQEHHQTKEHTLENYQTLLKETELLKEHVCEIVDKLFDADRNLTEEQDNALEFEIRSCNEKIQANEKELKDFRIQLELNQKKDNSLAVKKDDVQAKDNYQGLEQEVNNLFIVPRIHNEFENYYQSYVKKLSHLRSIEQHYLEEVMKRKLEASKENYLTREHHKERSR